MPHFKAFGMMNLQFKIRIYNKGWLARAQRRKWSDEMLLRKKINPLIGKSPPPFRSSTTVVGMVQFCPKLSCIFHL